MVAFLNVPLIELSPAEPALAPRPPTPNSDLSDDNDDDWDRPIYLSPPPNISPRQAQRLSSPKIHSPSSTGLEQTHFESLLNASRDRHSLLNGKRETDLRREVALKAHKSKQEERRARFLAKIGAPPSPTATHLPATPPESPALFHFTLPSPGLMSPLALFESLNLPSPKEESNSWVEQVDFHMPKAAPFNVPANLNSRRNSLPSLEEISLHLRVSSSPAPIRSRPPLPAFLTARRAPQVVQGDCVNLSRPSVSNQIVCLSPTPSRPVPNGPVLHVTTSVVPRTATTSPTALTEANLLAFEQRAKASHGLSTLKRRYMTEIDDKRERRFSAPPQLPVKDSGKPIGGF